MSTYPKINIVKYNRDVFLPVGNINTFGWECDDHKVFTISEDKEDLFRIIEEKLYIVKYPTVGNHDITIKMSDLFNRYDPIERNFTFNVSLCDNCQTGYICVELKGSGGDDGDDDTGGTDEGFVVTETLGTVERVLAGHGIGSQLRPLDPEVVNNEDQSQSTITIESDGSFNINSAESYLLNNDIDCIASGIDDRFAKNDFSSSCKFGARDSSSNKIRLNGQGGNVIFNQNFKSTHTGQLFNLQIGSGLFLQAPTQETFNEIKLEYTMEFAGLISPDPETVDIYIERFGVAPNEDGTMPYPEMFILDSTGRIIFDSLFDPNNIWQTCATRNIPLRRIVDSANSYESDDITNLVNKTTNITPQKQATAASLLNVWGYDSNGQSKSFPRYDNADSPKNILINDFSFLVNNGSSSEYKTSDNNAKNMFLDCAKIQAVRSEYNNPEAVTDRTCWGTVKFFTPSLTERYTPNGGMPDWPLNANFHIERPFGSEAVRHMLYRTTIPFLDARFNEGGGTFTMRSIFRHRFKISGLGSGGLNIETPEITFYEVLSGHNAYFMMVLGTYACEGGPGDDGIVTTPIRRDSILDENGVSNNFVPTTTATPTTTSAPVTAAPTTSAPVTTPAPTTAVPTTAAPTTAAPTTAAPTTAAPTTAAPTTAAPTTAAPTTAAPTTAAPTTAAPTTAAPTTAAPTTAPPTTQAPYYPPY